MTTPPAPAPVKVRVRILPRVPTAAPHATDDHADRSANGGTAAAKRRTRRRSRRDYDRDEHATAYLSCEDASFLIERWKEGLEGWNGGEVEGRACRLFRTIGCDGDGTSSADADGDDNLDEWTEGAEGRRRLWAPLILRTWPSGGESRSVEGGSAPSSTDAPTTATAASEESHVKINDQTSCIPTVSVPPCLASTLGLHPFHTAGPSPIISTTVECSLQPLPREDLVKATRATLREVGTPPPVPRLKWPSSAGARDGGADTGNDNKSGKDNAKTSGNGEGTSDDGEADEELRRFFLRPPKRIELDDDERQLHPVCRTQPQKPSKAKPRRRLLALGSIFAVPCYEEDDGRCHDEHVYDGDGGGSDRGRRVRDVRFYQVVDAAPASSAQTEDANDRGEVDATPNDKARSQRIAYVVSPSTHLTLLPSTNDESWGALHPQLDDVPAMEGATWRLPRPSLAKAFVQSIVAAGMAHGRMSHDGAVARTNDGGNARARGWRHPSAKEVADALYLQGTVPSRTIGAAVAKECRVCQRRRHRAAAPTNHPGPRMVHVVGKEENHVRSCVDEAADIMGMRAFHVDGLAAFWAHCHTLGTYSERPSSESRTAAPLTGGLSDKLRGLSASLALARHSSPCVLHICLDGELAVVDGHHADVDARTEEEGRILEKLREGIPAGGAGWHAPLWCEASSGGADASGGGRLAQDMFRSTATAPRVIVVVSTAQPLPPGYPLATSLWHPSVVIGAPDEPYARALWDDDADGTFERVAPYLRGLSAREVGQLRGQFVPRWEAETAKARGGHAGADDASAPSPVDVLQGLLPQLEAARAFARSSSQGGSGALPLAASSLPNVRWEDIGGLDSIRREITDAVELPLQHPALFAGSRRSGLLLFGPPGTGKTLVAKAVARECGLPFLSVKGPELLGSYVGESEANVRAVFDAARAAARDPPASSWTEGRVGRKEDVDDDAGGYAGASVLFFDELDSLAPRRGDTGHGDGVMDRVVATLLGELDGGSGESGDRRSDAHVIVIGATNRPDLLDPSLLRPGRFDRLLYLGPAKTREHCLQILLAQTRKFRFEHGRDARAVLEQAMESFPPALSGADLSAVASGALMRGLQRVCERVEAEVRLINARRGQDSDNPEYAVDIDDVMGSWSKEDLQPVMTAEDFTEAAKAIVPSISQQDLESFERLQLQYSSGQYT